MTDTFPDELREEFRHNAGLARINGDIVVAACFNALAASVKDIPPELLTAYLELLDRFTFEDTETSVDAVIKTNLIEAGLTDAIECERWLPASATEYLQRFVAIASGTQPFR